jgi:hypothetical protein
MSSVAYEIADKTARDCYLECLHVSNCHSIGTSPIRQRQTTSLGWRSSRIDGTAAETVDRDHKNIVGLFSNWESIWGSGEDA